MRSSIPALSLLALALCVSARSASAQPSTAELQTHLARAQSAWDASRAAEARSEFQWLAVHAPAELAARAFWHLAALDEQDGRYAEALAGYRRSLQLDPGGRYAGRADARVDFLQRRAEGGFDALAQLQAMRANNAALQDPAQLRAFAATAQRWSHSESRAEGLLLAAASFARLGDASEAERSLRLVLEQRRSPAGSRVDALRLLEQLTEARGTFAEFARDCERWDAPSAMTQRARQRARRVKLHRFARGWLLAVAAIGVTLLGVALRRGHASALAHALRAPLPWLQLGALCVGSGVLARTWGQHDARPFWALAAGVALLHAAAVASRVALPKRAWLAGLKLLLFAVAVLCVAFEATFAYDQGMLEGIGL